MTLTQRYVLMKKYGQAICPKCKLSYPKELYALSRKDNYTRICNDCGTREALTEALFPTLS